MKKLLAIILKATLFFLLVFISIGNLHAQHLKKDGTPDRRYKENRTTTYTSTPAPAPQHIAQPNHSATQPTNTTQVKTQTAPSGNSDVRIGCICSDGTRSSATGRGACSHHGGVSRWLYK